MGHKCPPFFDFAIMVRISSTAPVADVARTSALKYGQVLQTAHREVPGVNSCGHKWAVFFEVAISVLHMTKVWSNLTWSNLTWSNMSWNTSVILLVQE